MQPPSMPPTDKNDAVLTYDPVNKIILALVKVTTGEGDAERHAVQTWVYDAGANKWTRMNPAVEPAAGGNRTRNLTFAPELNLAILENCLGQPREQQVWTYRYADNKAKYEPPQATTPDVPPRVDDVVVSVLSKNRVEVSWTAPATAKATGYHVERAAVEVWTDDQLTRLKKSTPPLALPSVGAIRCIGPFQQLTARPIGTTSFVDDGVDLESPKAISGQPVYDSDLHPEQVDPSGRGYHHAVFAYRVRAVGGGDKVGGPSPAIFTIPSSPQQFFSHEDGTTCRLKWAANPEKGIGGYRVYRMDGRWDKDPVSRLTADPQAETTFADETAGKHTRRYYVVAVDALGQEGFPSAPVWYEREWRAYYAPFVGEWHQ
jgi:hypothetical protein